MPKYYDLDPIIINQRLEEEVSRLILKDFIGPIGEIIYEFIFNSHFTEDFLNDLKKIRHLYLPDIT